MTSEIFGDVIRCYTLAGVLLWGFLGFLAGVAFACWALRKR